MLAMLLKPMSIFLTLTDGRMPGNDDYVRLAQVRDWMNGAGWFDVGQIRLGADGIAMHWSRVIDPFIAGLIRVFEPLIRTCDGRAPDRDCLADADVRTGSLGDDRVIARRLAPTLHPALIGVIGGLNGTAVMQFEPGRIDHHNVQILLMMVAVLGGVDEKRRRGGIVAGLACAASMMIGMEALVLIGLFGLLFATRWVVGDDTDGRRFGAFGAAFAAGIVAVYGVDTPPSEYFSTVCDRLSLAYGLPGIVAGIATFLVISSRVHGQSDALRRLRGHRCRQCRNTCGRRADLLAGAIRGAIGRGRNMVAAAGERGAGPDCVDWRKSGLRGWFCRHSGSDHRGRDAGHLLGGESPPLGLGDAARSCRRDLRAELRAGSARAIHRRDGDPAAGGFAAADPSGTSRRRRFCKARGRRP